MKVDLVATSTAMRELWEQNATWTRLDIVSTSSSLPDAQATAERVLRNQDDIGAAMKPFYGNEAGTQLTVLMRNYMARAADMIKAARAGDQASLGRVKRAWYANADDVAAFLSRTNPKNWPVDHLKTMLHTNVDETTAEVTHRLKGDYPAEIADYDAIEDHDLNLADTLSAGVMAQFPDRVLPPSLPPSQAAFRSAMRKLWEEHVSWTRFYMVSASSALPDVQPTADRLLRNQDDIGAAIKPYYGEQAAARLSQLLRTHISQTADLIKAAKAGDQAALGQARDAWYANAGDIAVFLSQANPRNWSVDQLKTMLDIHLDKTIAELTNRIQGNHEAEVADYDIVEDQILTLADTLSTGIVAQFPEKFTG
jgi:hypothetical protein